MLPSDHLGTIYPFHSSKNNTTQRNTSITKGLWELMGFYFLNYTNYHQSLVGAVQTATQANTIYSYDLLWAKYVCEAKCEWRGRGLV